MKWRAIPPRDRLLTGTNHYSTQANFNGHYPCEAPRNKDRIDAKETYSSHCLGYLRLGVHLMLVDVLPRPRGFSFSDAITTGLGMELPPLPPFPAAYRVGEVVPVAQDMGSLVGLWPCSLGVAQPLPALPLNVHQAVLIDLEETYWTAALIAWAFLLEGQPPLMAGKK